MLDFKKANNDVVLVVDTNLGLEHARRIGDDGYDVYYSVVHAEPYPKLEDEICGLGFEEVKKVWDWGEGLENGANIVIFTDSGFGGLANWLRNEGYYVFGADAISESYRLRKAIELATERAEAVSTSSIYTQGRELMAYIDEVREKLKEMGYVF